MKLHIHLVHSGRGHLFQKCCESVAHALTPDCRVTVILNGAHPFAEQWLREWNHPQFNFYSVPKESRIQARNRAFFVNAGDILYFLDDDVEVPSSLFTDVLRRFREDSSLSILGGPNLTPPASPFKEHWFGALMASPFSAPWVHRRYHATEGPSRPATEYDLILCNLAVRRAHLPAGLSFREGLRSNEENVFLLECLRRGLRTEYDPRIYVFHHRRKTLASFYAQIASYGYGRAQQLFYQRAAGWPVFLVPTICIGVGGMLAMQPRLYPILFALLGLHALGTLLGALRSPLRSLGLCSILGSIPLTLALHSAYGIGFARGLIRQVGQVLRPHSPPTLIPRPVT